MDLKLVVLFALLAMCCMADAKKKDSAAVDEATDVTADDATDVTADETTDVTAEETAGGKASKEKKHGKDIKEKKHGKASGDKKHGKASGEKGKKGARKFPKQKKRGDLPDSACVCSTWGDPHYTTFDGIKIDFQGNCSYFLLISDVIEVSALNKFRDEDAIVALEEEIFVTIYDDVNDDIISVTLHQDDLVRVDGITVIPPVQLNEHYSIDAYGKGVILLGDNGFWVTWDFNNRANIGAPEEYKGLLSGMCGNCDDSEDDDLMMPDGSQAETWVDFGNSWKTGEHCIDVIDTAKPCSSEMEVEHASDEECGMIINPNGPFAECGYNLGDTRITGLYESCMFDMCYTPTNRDSILCTNLGTAYDECSLHGLPVGEFRTDSFCRLSCPNNAYYSETASACPNTCTDQTASSNCNDRDVEACVCVDGYFLSGDECVKPEHCGAIDENNMYHKLDDHWLTPDCSEMRIVTGPDSIESEDMECEENQVCEIVGGGYHCVGTEEIISAPVVDPAMPADCAAIGGVCAVSCATGSTLPEVAADKMLCTTGLTCCIVVQTLCSKAHFGAFCAPSCNNDMNSIASNIYCKGAPEGHNMCCKPIIKHGMGIYEPEPVIIDGELVAPPPAPLGPITPEEMAAMGPPGVGEPVPEGWVAMDDEIGGILVPVDLGHGDPVAAGELGDPRVTTLDGKKYKLVNDACDYCLMCGPEVAVIARHAKGTQNGEAATFVTQIHAYFRGIWVDFLEGNQVEIDGTIVTDELTHEFKAFADGHIHMKLTINDEAIVANFGDAFGVTWRGNNNRVKVFSSLTDVHGLLGNNNDDPTDDLQYMKNGELVTLGDDASQLELREFGADNIYGVCENQGEEIPFIPGKWEGQ